MPLTKLYSWLTPWKVRRRMPFTLRGTSCGRKSHAWTLALPFQLRLLEIFLGNYSTTKLFRDLWGISNLISPFPRGKIWIIFSRQRGYLIAHLLQYMAYFIIIRLYHLVSTSFLRWASTILAASVFIFGSYRLKLLLVIFSYHHHVSLIQASIMHKLLTDQSYNNPYVEAQDLKDWLNLANDQLSLR